MNEPAIRVYADTSVYGGVLDDEFAEPTNVFFDQVARGRFRLVLSTVVMDELEAAPKSVRALFEERRRTGEIIDVTEEALTLQEAYLQANILGRRWETDALHVALATVAQCRLIVSWNFRHLVNFEKIPLYNGVNLAKGYAPVAIHTPQEVIAHEDQDV